MMNTPSSSSGINFRDYIGVLKRRALYIALVVIVVSGGTGIVLSLLPATYRATAVVAPQSDGGRNTSPLIGVITSFGIPTGAPSQSEDLEIIFRSADLAVRVLSDPTMRSYAYGPEYDAKTGQLRSGLFKRLMGIPEWRTPDAWDAIRVARRQLLVSSSRKYGTVTVAFEAASPDGAAAVLRRFLEEAKTRLQEESLAHATGNKRFLEEQISRTADALTRDRLYVLLSHEVEREMLARNREQYGFRIVDVPRSPDGRIRPLTGRIVIGVAFVTFLLAIACFSLVDLRRGSTPPDR